MEATKITWTKAKSLIRKAECAYLYNDGSLYLTSRETVRGATVDVKTLIKGYTKPWLVTHYEKDYNSRRDDRMARIIFYGRTDKGCLTLKRPNSVEVFTGSMSEKSKPLNVGTVGVRFRYGGENIKLEYLSSGIVGKAYGCETWESYLVSAEFTLQTGLDETPGEDYSPSEFNELLELDSFESTKEG